MPLKTRTQTSDIAAKDETPARARSRSRASELAEPGKDGPRRYDDLLRDSLAYAIKRTQVRCDEALSRYLDPGLSPARFAALCAVGANPGISQAALSGLLNIAGPSVVKVVDELERMDLVKRTPSSDRRVYALQLTERGGSDLKRYHASNQAFEKKITATMTAQERTQLLGLLAKVAPDEP